MQREWGFRLCKGERKWRRALEIRRKWPCWEGVFDTRRVWIGSVLFELRFNQFDMICINGSSVKNLRSLVYRHELVNKLDHPSRVVIRLLINKLAILLGRSV